MMGAMGTGTVTIDAATFLPGSDFTTDNAFAVTHATSTVNTNGHDLAVSGDVAGAGVLNKSGAGTLTLTGNNAFSGGLDIAAGSVIAADDGAMGTGTVTVGAATFEPGSDFSTDNVFALTHAASTIDTGSYNLAVSGDVGGVGTLNKTGSGTLTLTGDNVFSGGLDIADGAVVAGDDGAMGTAGVTVGAATFLPGSNFSADNAFTVTDSSSTVDTNGYGLTLSGDMDGNGKLNKSGDGTLTLTGNNTFTGGMEIAEGEVIVRDEDAMGAGRVTIGAGSFAPDSDFDTDHLFTLADSSSTINTNGHELTLNSDVTGVGALNKTGSGTLTLIGDNTFRGGLDIDAGSVMVQDDGAMGVGTVSIGSGTLLTGSTFATDNAFAVTHGSAMIDIGNDDLTLNGNVSGNGTLNKAGAGTLTLNGNNTFSGGMDITAGTVVVQDGDALGSGAVAIGAATLLPGSSFSVDNAFVLAHSSSQIDIDTYDLTLNGNVSGVGGLNKMGSGILTLGGDNTFSGGLSIAAGDGGRR